MPLFFIIIITFLILSALLLWQIFLAFKEKFIDKQRIFLVATMIFVLGTSILFPSGLINFSTFEDNLLIAQAEGGGNCTTTLKFKNGNKFIERNVCFGISETLGTYVIKNDTVFFNAEDKAEYYEFAIINEEEIIRYKNYSDTIGRALQIVKNELTE